MLLNRIGELYEGFLFITNLTRVAAGTFQIMTRANLNFVYQDSEGTPRTLFHYSNGDQYPSGLRDHYGVRDFLKIDGLWTPEDFKEWIHQNYREDMKRSPNTTIPMDLGERGQPKIYYTDGNVTDYSYVFTHQLVETKGSKGHGRSNWVKVFNWDEKIFDGPAKQAMKWFEQQAL